MKIYEERDYYKVHLWIKYHYGSAKICENKFCLKRSKTFQWSLIKGKKCEKNRENFWRLCRSCHSIYDFTDKTRQRLSLKKIGKRYAAKPVLQMSLNGKHINKFDSLTKASSKTGILVTSISQAINGIYKTAGGYKWKFL